MRMCLLASVALITMSSVQAAEAPSACDAAPATIHIIESWRRAASDATLSWNGRMDPMWKAIDADPDNLFLHLALQPEYLNMIEAVRWPEAEGHYQRLLQAHPDLAGLRIAYASLIASRRPDVARPMLEQIVTADSSQAWAHLTLARLAQMEHKTEEVDRAVRRFNELCPASLQPEPYRLYDRMPLEFRRAVAAALRKRVEGRTDPQALAMLGILWQLEFQVNAAPVPELRARVAQDLVRLREAAAGSERLLTILGEGAELIDDREAARWAREQQRAAHSFQACDLAMKRWSADRRAPSVEDSQERVQGYYRELLEASTQWVEACPLYEAPWWARLRALRELPDASPDEVIRTGDGLLRASSENSSNFFFAPTLPVSELYLKRRVALDRIPAILQRAKADAQARVAADREVRNFPESWKEGEARDAQERGLLARRLQIERLVDLKQTEAAQTEWSALRQEAKAITDAGMFWSVQPHLFDAALVLHDDEHCEQGLRSMREWLDGHAPRESDTPSARREFREHEALYWEKTGRLAEQRGRTADAIEAYQRTLELRSMWEPLADRFALIDRTRQLWAAAGHPVNEWDAWMQRTTATRRVPAVDWAKVERRFPAFALTDLSGRRWSERDLTGKVTFVNLWATWCGPCRAELPHVRKIAEAVSARKDVQVITLNVDDQPGGIEPFLRQVGISGLTVIPARDYVTQELGIRGFPTSWIIDRDGVARREMSGFSAEPSKWVAEVVRQLGTDAPEASTAAGGSPGERKQR